RHTRSKRDWSSDVCSSDLMEEHLDPHHSGPPEHIHPYQTEQFSVTAGKLSVVMDTEEQVFGPGETVEIPRGTAHTFRNDGATRRSEERRVGKGCRGRGAAE